MYQTVGLWKVITTFALVAVLCALIYTYFQPISAPMEFWRIASSSVSIAGLAMLGLGQTPVFTLLCKFPLIRHIFPPIDGIWIAKLNSNFPVIARGFNLEPPSDAPVITKFTIKARLFNVRISSVSISPKPGYMRSNTTAFRISKCSQTERIVIHYVYDAFVGDPKESDVDRFYGAARLTVIEEDNEIQLEGTYWTDRNWQKGFNTAGSIKLERHAISNVPA